MPSILVQRFHALADEDHGSLRIAPLHGLECLASQSVVVLEERLDFLDHLGPQVRQRHHVVMGVGVGGNADHPVIAIRPAVALGLFRLDGPDLNGT